MKRLALLMTLTTAATFAGIGAYAQTPTAVKKEAKAADKEATLTFEVFKDAKGEFRWRLKATNSKIIADSGEGYKTKADCMHGIDLIKEGASKATTDDKS